MLFYSIDLQKLVILGNVQIS